MNCSPPMYMNSQVIMWLNYILAHTFYIERTHNGWMYSKIGVKR